MGGRRRIAGVAAAVAVLAAGCSPAASNGASAEDRAEEAREATRQLEAAEREDLGCDNVVMSEEQRTTAPPEHLVLLTDAYAVGEACWDKIVFTFEPTGADMPPSYDARYEKGPFTEGPEGQFTVETLGNAFLVITFAPASSTENGDPEAPKTYLGNLRLRLDETIHHTQIVRKLIDGPGAVTWIIGLDAKRPFTVDAANQPPRVSVYIAR